MTDITSLDEMLSVSKPARLIPTIAQSRKEERLVSVLLGTLGVVHPLAKIVLDRCGQSISKTTKVSSVTEVPLPDTQGQNKNRPDGLICVLKRGTRWTALLEAKVGTNAIEPEQIQRYADAARRFDIDAIITLSNQLVPLPTHIPYTISKRLSNRMKFFHLSWVSILTDASILLRDRSAMNAEQAFVLNEMVHYFEHPNSGVKSFDLMNEEWPKLIQGIRNEQHFKRTSEEIKNTVSSWHQQERDLCLILSRRIGKPINIRMPKKHRDDPELRLRETSDILIESKELRSSFTVPNAAGDLDVTVNLQRRTVYCSMELKAPGDKKRASARINWLVRQLKEVDGTDVFIRTFWTSRGSQTQASLTEVLINPKCLMNEQKKALPSRFEVVMVMDLAGRFKGRIRFIEDIEKLVPEYYDRVGQHLRAWTPPPPPIDKEDPIRESGNASNQEINRPGTSSEDITDKPDQAPEEDSG